MIRPNPNDYPLTIEGDIAYQRDQATYIAKQHELDSLVLAKNKIQILESQVSALERHNYELRLTLESIDARARLDRLNISEFKYKWISVKDKLPDRCTDCIAYLQDHESVIICKYFNGFSILSLSGLGDPPVTHWMPLPLPPINLEKLANENKAT